MHKTGHSKPVQWDNSEGWDGEGGWGGEMGGGFGMEDTCAPMVESHQCMAKLTTIL